MFRALRTAATSLTGRGLLLCSTGAVLVGLGGGAAYAAWNVSATGSSQAAAGTPIIGVVTAATPTASLYPGASTPVYFTVTNPNSFPVTYNVLTFGTVSVNGDSATCDPAVHLTVTEPAISISLAPGTTSSIQTPPGAVTMASSAPDGCQGRTFTIPTSLSGVSG